MPILANLIFLFILNSFLRTLIIKLSFYYMHKGSQYNTKKMGFTARNSVPECVVLCVARAGHTKTKTVASTLPTVC